MTATLALLNRFLPPAPGVTGELLFGLAAALARRLPELRFEAIGTDLGYGRPTAAPPGPPLAGVTRLRSLQRRGWSPVRPLATAVDGWRMARRARAADIVLSLTDPPLLNRWLAHGLGGRQHWIEWTMDLYPDAFRAALGQTPRPRPHGGRRPDLRLCLGPGQADYLARDGLPPVPHLLMPAGVRPAPRHPAPARRDGPVRLVYAGNLGRAHPAGALLRLAALLDEGFRLTLSPYGSGAARLRHEMAGHPRIDWAEGPLSDAVLDAADVHVAALGLAWTHLCVPSKAISALCRGKPVLFFGSPDSDVCHWAGAAGWPVGDDTSLAQALRHIADPDARAAARAAAIAAGDRLRQVERHSLDALAHGLAAMLGGGARPEPAPRESVCQ